MTSSVWPPPAPPEYVDRSQLPTNLRPSSLTFQRRDEDDKDISDDVHDVDGPTDTAVAPLMRQRSSGSEAGAASTARAHTDHSQTSERDSEQSHASAEADVQLKRQHSDLSHDKVPPPHQLKRSSSDTPGEREPDVQAKRLSNIAIGDERSQPVTSTGRSPAVIDADEPATRHQSEHVSESPVVSTAVSQEKTESHGQTDRHADQVAAVPPRFMQKAASDDPMVIEFSAARCTSDSTTDNVSVRAGHKRARINSDTVHNDVIRQSFVRQPVTFYGNFAPLLLRTDSHTFYSWLRHWPITLQ